MQESRAKKASPKRVVVTVLPDAKGECRVDTPEAHVCPGGTVAFRSEVGPLKVFVPRPARADDLFPRAVKPVFDVPASGKELMVSAKVPNAPVTYPYTVFCCKHGSFAHASFPRFIVD